MRFTQPRAYPFTSLCTLFWMTSSPFYCRSLTPAAMKGKNLAALPSSFSSPDAAADGFYSLGYRRPPGAYGSAAAAKTYYYYGERPVRALVCALVLDGFGGFRFRFVFNSGKSLLSPSGKRVHPRLGHCAERRRTEGEPHEEVAEQRSQSRLRRSEVAVVSASGGDGEGSILW